MIGRGESKRLQVRLFGAPGVQSPQGSVRLSPLQLALVAVVYGHAPKGIGRPDAARLLWGCEAGSGARHRLRQLLVEVRSRVGARIIQAQGDLLKPQPEVACDLTTFEQSLDGGSLLDAALLARTGFVRTTLDSIADDFEDWRLAAEVSHLRRLRIQADARWAHASAAGDWLTAKDAAEASYALDPLNPEAVIRMIDALGLHGQPESAERVFAEFRAACDDRAAVPPTVEEAIGRVRRLKHAGPRIVAGSDGDVPMIGRREALAAARSALDRLQAGGFHLVLIGGESGIGKTRMLGELHREAVLRGFRCLEAQSVELESRIPLNPLLDVLKGVDLRPHLADLGRPWNSVVGAMLPIGALDEPLQAPPPIQESALPRRLLDAFAMLFESLATEQPTVLFLDDFQWADPTTVAALQFMQRRWSRGSLGVMATVRPDLVASTDPVATYLAPRNQAPGFQRIDLGELAKDEALRLVEHIGGGEIGEELAHRICALAGLHPLYLTELARDYLAGRLRLPELPDDEVTIPVSLKQILDARLTYLSEPAMKLAGLLAVAGRPMRLGDVSRLAGLSVDTGADAVDELRRSRLVQHERDRVRIAHELFRSAIYRHLSEPRRAINHRAVAEHIEAGVASDSVGELATHYARAGESELAAKYGWKAATRAMESGAVAEAAHFYQLVIDNVRDPVHRADATGALARALHLTRDINRANPLLELAANRLYSVGKPADALRLEIKRVEGLAEVGAAALGDLLERLSEIKAQARERSDWEGLALALDVELSLRHRASDVSGIAKVFDEMRFLAAGSSTEASILCLAGLAMGILFGDPDEALRSAQQAVGLTNDGRPYRLKALLRLMVVLQYRGMLELPDSAAIVQEARELAQKSGDVLLHFSIESNLGVAALDAGDLDRAAAQMKRASTISGSADMDLNRFIEANNAAELALAQQDYRSAEAHYLQAASFAGPNTPSYLMDLVHAGSGLCALETGRLADARSREQQLGAAPDTWHYDPTTILAFRSRLLERRSQLQTAIELLETAASDLENRLVLAWLKTRALQVRLMKKAGDPKARTVASEAVARAVELNLTHRAREFSIYCH